MVRTVLVLALLLTGCTQDGEPGGSSDVPSESPTSSTAGDPGTPAPSGSPSPDRSPVVVAWERVGDGFDNPLQVLGDPVTGDTLVVEQAGRVTTLGGEVVLDLTARIEAGGERGLLGANLLDEDLMLVHYSARGTGATVLAQVPRAL